MFFKKKFRLIIHDKYRILRIKSILRLLSESIRTHACVRTRTCNVKQNFANASNWTCARPRHSLICATIYIQYFWRNFFQTPYYPYARDFCFLSSKINFVLRNRLSLTGHRSVSKDCGLTSQGAETLQSSRWTLPSVVSSLADREKSSWNHCVVDESYEWLLRWQ